MIKGEWIAGVGIIIVLASVLTAVVMAPGSDASAPPVSSVYAGRALLRTVIDPETGCQYLSIHSEITPRLDRDGKPVCGAAK